MLLETQEYPTDRLLVSLVRVQQICNKSMQAVSNEANSTYNAKSVMDQEFYVQILKSQLEEIKISLSPDLKSNGIYISTYIFAMGIYLHCN